MLLPLQDPVPHINDTFATLSVGVIFSKSEYTLAQAYLEMEVEESNRKPLTINTHKGLFQHSRLVYVVASVPVI